MTKISVHLHLYYVDQLDDLLSRLQSLNGYSYDLYVTLIKDDDFIRNKILAFKPDAKIWQVPNLGYDVGPFIDFLHKIDLDNYDYIIKIHTKRTQDDKFCIFNGNRFNMKVWREMLLDAVVSSKAVENNLQILKQNDKIGMIGNDYLLTDEKFTYRNQEEEITAEMAKIGLEVPQDRHFIVGTMFWIRAKLLKPFLSYKIDDFAISDEKVHDKTLAHVLERMFGLAVTTQGYQIKGLHYKSFLPMFIRVALVRFLFQKKVTHKGNLIIKICKIPIYYRKEKL